MSAAGTPMPGEDPGALVEEPGEERDPVTDPGAEPEPPAPQPPPSESADRTT